MNKDCLRCIAIFCHNAEELIRNNFADSCDYVEQKVVLDLYLSVLNYQHWIEKKGIHK